MREAVGPQDEGDTVDGTGPPWRTNSSRHVADQSEDLATVEDRFLDVGDASLMHPDKLLVGAVEVLSSC